MEQFYYITTCVLFAVLGLCIGSFLNVLIYRLPRGMNLAKPASHCTVCGHKLAWYDNIPLLSYLILRGKCRSCGARISPRYFLVELSNAALWISCCLAVYRDVTSIPVAAVYALALSVLLTMAVVMLGVKRTDISAFTSKGFSSRSILFSIFSRLSARLMDFSRLKERSLAMTSS